MSRPPMLTPAAKLAQRPHGTRTRYVAGGCRCKKCKAANAKAARDRVQLVRAAAADVKPTGPPLAGTLERGGRLFAVKRCPGVNGARCAVDGGAWLRTGGPVCTRCIERAAVWNGLVPAEQARSHLQKLSKQGVGRRAVSAACDVPSSILAAIIRGTKTTIRARTERAVLNVDKGALADSSSVSAARTWKRINHLLQEGFTEKELARRLGYTTPKLQLGRERISARNALKVERFYRLIMVGGSDTRLLDGGL